MERLAWFHIDEISAQFLRALPNQEGIMKTSVFNIEGVRTFLGIKSHILVIQLVLILLRRRGQEKKTGNERNGKHVTTI